MSGFHHANITKGLMIFTGLVTLGASLLGIKPYLHLQLVPHISKYHQFWRIATHSIAFQNSTELLVALLTLSNTGCVIERAFGPRKYASFVLLSILVSTFINFIALIVLYTLFGLNRIPAGPYGLIFSLLWQRYRIIPAVYTFKIGGLEVSNEVWVYLIAVQLLLSDIPSSIIAASIGLLTGYIYRADRLPLPIPSILSGTRRTRWLRPLKTYKLPSGVYHLLSRLLGGFISNNAPPRRSARTIPGQSRDVPTGAFGVGVGVGVGVGGDGFGGLIGGRFGGGPATGVPTATAAGRSSAPRTPVTGSGRPNSSNMNLTPGGTGVAASILGRNRTLAAAAATAAGRTEVSRGTEGRRSPGDGEQDNAVTAAGARRAMGEWVSEMTGRGSTRAPTEEEITTLTSMFPNISREAIVRALQRNDNNTAQAVEALLQESM